jgi:hypothetical protein
VDHQPGFFDELADVSVPPTAPLLCVSVSQCAHQLCARVRAREGQSYLGARLSMYEASHLCRCGLPCSSSRMRAFPSARTRPSIHVSCACTPREAFTRAGVPCVPFLQTRCISFSTLTGSEKLHRPKVSTTYITTWSRVDRVRTHATTTTLNSVSQDGHRAVSKLSSGKLERSCASVL